MKHVLVTGGAGMIGSNLVKHLTKNNTCEIRVADNLWRGKLENLEDSQGSPVIDMAQNFFKVDLRDAMACAQVVDGIDEIYHLADVVAGIKYVLANQTEVFHDNALIDTNMLRAASQTNVKRFLYVGTACSYPKKMQFGVEAPPLVEEDVYGTPADFSAEKSQVIPSLIVKAIRYPSEPFVVWGSGTQCRSFVHVDDVVEGLVLMMAKGLGKGAVQIGTNFCTSIREIAETIVKISGKKIDVNYDITQPEGDKGRCADCSKAEKILEWKPKVSLEEGLRRTYQWIGEQVKKVDVE